MSNILFTDSEVKKLRKNKYVKNVSNIRMNLKKKLYLKQKIIKNFQDKYLKNVI